MNTLEQHVLRLIGESIASPDVFTDDASGMALIRGSLNDALQELATVTGSYVDTYTVQLCEGVMFYRIRPPEHYLGYVLQAWDAQRRYKVPQMDMQSILSGDGDMMETQGSPQYYWMIGHEWLGVYPTPDSSSGILQLTCAFVPAPYSDDDERVKVRHNWANAAVYYAVSEFYASRGDANRAVEYHKRYLESAGIAEINPIDAQRKFQFSLGWSRYAGFSGESNQNS